MSNWVCYKDGPFWGFPRFFIEMLKFWKWKKMKKSWIFYSIRSFFGMESSHQEFLYLLSKFKNKKFWFEMEDLVLITKEEYDELRNR